ncbi:MAG: hypothetical protein HYR87_01955 [Thaumarchaeota archaeon]|nr:hypothetical protein [Nitrososphaerota archaeon]
MIVAIISLFFTIVSAIAAVIVVPEIRKRFELDEDKNKSNQLNERFRPLTFLHEKVFKPKPKNETVTEEYFKKK